MTMTHTGTLWQYLTSFVFYTGLAIGVIYAVYFYARKHGGALLTGSKKPVPSAISLEIESSLPLEPRKTLYVVRAGDERFLIAAAMESTHLISKLGVPPDGVAAGSISGIASMGRAVTAISPVGAASPIIPAGQPGRSGAPDAVGATARAIDLPPWYTQPEATATDLRPAARPGVRARLRQSIEWLVASRIK